MRIWMHGGVCIITERYRHRSQVEIQGVLSGMRRGVTTRSAGSFLEVRGHAGIQGLAERA